MPQSCPDPVVVDAFAHPTRLEILVFCEDRPRGPAEIAAELDLTTSALRHHVAVLERSGLLHDGPRGFHSGVGWSRLLAELERIARGHAEHNADTEKHADLSA